MIYEDYAGRSYAGRMFYGAVGIRVDATLSITVAVVTFDIASFFGVIVETAITIGWMVVGGFVHLSRFRSLSVIDRIDFLLCVGFYFLFIESFAAKDAAQMSSSSIKELFDGTISGKFLSQEGSYEWERSTVNSIQFYFRLQN